MIVSSGNAAEATAGEDLRTVATWLRTVQAAAGCSHADLRKSLLSAMQGEIHRHHRSVPTLQKAL